MLDILHQRGGARAAVEYICQELTPGVMESPAVRKREREISCVGSGGNIHPSLADGEDEGRDGTS